MLPERCSGLAGIGLLAGCEGEPRAERRAAARRGLVPQTASVGGHDGRYDREPQARPAAFRRAPGVGAKGAVEDAWRVLRIDARTVIDNAQLGSVVLEPEGHLDGCRGGGGPVRWRGGCR